MIEDGVIFVYIDLWRANLLVSIDFRLRLSPPLEACSKDCLTSFS